MITHRDEIFARPKRTWFVSEKEKKLVANAGKVTFCIIVAIFILLFCIFTLLSSGNRERI